MKNFDEWNKIKKKVNIEKPRFYTVREIWWCRFGLNIGTEQDGKGEKYVRPCVILRGFGADACLVVPLTTSRREHVLRIDIGFVDGDLSKANLSQIRVIDTRRLQNKIEFLEKGAFVKLKKTAKDILF